MPPLFVAQMLTCFLQPVLPLALLLDGLWLLVEAAVVYWCSLFLRGRVLVSRSGQVLQTPRCNCIGAMTFDYGFPPPDLSLVVVLGCPGYR